MARPKTKTMAAAVPVPQNRDDAAVHVRVIGDLNREIARVELDLSDHVALLKEEAEKISAPLKAAVEAHTEGLKMWAEANRDRITNGNKVKYADLGTGKIMWRIRPPSVRLTKVEAVIERIKQLGLTAFLRTKEEVNKEALLADPDRARLVAGVAIGSEGEDFVVEPYEAALSKEVRP